MRYEEIQAITERSNLSIATRLAAPQSPKSRHHNQEIERPRMSEDSLPDIVERLFSEFELRHSLPQITAVVQRSREHLQGEPEGALAELVERLARQRLATLSENNYRRG
jgi:hypothetical protein